MSPWPPISQVIFPSLTTPDITIECAPAVEWSPRTHSKFAGEAAFSARVKALLLAHHAQATRPSSDMLPMDTDEDRAVQKAFQTSSVSCYSCCLSLIGRLDGLLHHKKKRPSSSGR